MPGSGYCVVKGYGPLRAPEPVSRSCSSGLAAVRRPDQRDLRGTLRPHDQRGTTADAALLRSGNLLVEFLDAALQVGLQVIGALVLRDHAEHLAQVIEPLLRVACLAEGVGGSLVLG